MKRIKITKILLLIVSIFLITGCTSPLKCSIKTNNYISSIKINFKKDKPTKYIYQDKMFFSKKSTDSEFYYHSKYQEYSTLIYEKHAHIRKKIDSVSLKITYDFSKNNSKDENILIINKNDTIKTATQKIESLGYKCK